MVTNRLRYRDKVTHAQWLAINRNLLLVVLDTESLKQAFWLGWVLVRDVFRDAHWHFPFSVKNPLWLFSWRRYTQGVKLFDLPISQRSLSSHCHIGVLVNHLDLGGSINIQSTKIEKQGLEEFRVLGIMGLIHILVMTLVICFCFLSLAFDSKSELFPDSQYTNKLGLPWLCFSQ